MLTEAIQMAEPLRREVSYAEYLQMEEASPERSEFLRGCVYAMAGGSIEHAAIASAVARHLGNALDGRPCVVLGSDFRVRVAETDLTTYPDVSVWCGPVTRPVEDPHAGTNPVMLVEVLSPSTRDYDLGSKAQHYRRLSSLRHLLFVESGRRAVEVWTLGDGEWLVREVTEGEVELAHLGVTLAVDALYAGTEGLSG